MAELRFRGGHRSASSVSEPALPADDLQKQTLPPSGLRRFFKAVDLRFDSRDAELAFKGSLEHDLLRNGVSGSLMNAICWIICILQTCDQEGISILRLLSFSVADVKDFSVLLYLSATLCTGVVILVLLLRQRFGWCQNCQYEILAAVPALYSPDCNLRQGARHL